MNSKKGSKQSAKRATKKGSKKSAPERRKDARKSWPSAQTKRFFRSCEISGDLDARLREVQKTHPDLNVSEALRLTLERIGKMEEDELVQEARALKVSKGMRDGLAPNSVEPEVMARVAALQGTEARV